VFVRLHASALQFFPAHATSSITACRKLYFSPCLITAQTTH